MLGSLGGLGVEHVHRADEQQHAAAHLKALQRDVEELQNLQPSSAQAAITQNDANAAVRMVLRRCAAEKPWV